MITLGSKIRSLADESIHMSPRNIFVIVFLLAVGFDLKQGASIHAVGQELPALTELQVVSSLDSTEQPILYRAPPTASQQSTPLFVFLHSWSGDYRQKNTKWELEAHQRGWIFLHPNFRGINQTPQACGSKFARQDILDAIDVMSKKYRVDKSRIYLAGVSGGGHMSMLMAGHHPDRFSAVSAWVGISDLASWYQFHLKDGKPQRYARMIAACLGGPPGESVERDKDYRDRSPLFHIHRAVEVPIDICTGINDGYTGSVPVTHSLLAFNAIAKANGDEPISKNALQSLRELRRPPGGTEPFFDKDFDRDIFYQRQSKNARITVFDGGHESVPKPAFDWLSKHQRTTTGK